MKAILLDVEQQILKDVEINGFKEMQAAVEGDIECPLIIDNIAVYSNEESRFNPKWWNEQAWRPTDNKYRTFFDVPEANLFDIVGPILFCASDDEGGDIDMTDAQKTFIRSCLTKQVDGTWLFKSDIL